MNGEYIAYNGAPASGKTTMARNYAQAAGCEQLLHDEHMHPAIQSGEIFTQGSDISAERWFVELHKSNIATYTPIPEKGLVTDNSVQCDLVYARALLTGKELREFEDYYHEATKDIPVPDAAYLLIHDSSKLLQRIHRRIQAVPERAFEHATTIEHLDKVQTALLAHKSVLAQRVEVIDLRYVK